MYLKWKDFVTKSWDMPRPIRDLKLINKEGAVCQKRFSYNELVSCVKGSIDDVEYVELKKKNTGPTFSGHLPLYELKRDKSGEPYESVTHLRAAKIRNHLNVSTWDWVPHSIPVQYEALVRKGTEFLLREIEEYVGVERACKAVPPQIIKPRRLPKKFTEWLTEHIDWEAENLIGYREWGSESDELPENDEQERQKDYLEI